MDKVSHQRSVDVDIRSKLDGYITSIIKEAIRDVLGSEAEFIFILTGSVMQVCNGDEELHRRVMNRARDIITFGP